MVNSFDYVFDPRTSKNVSIFSSTGRKALSGFLKEQRGGAKRVSSPLKRRSPIRRANRTQKGGLKLSNVVRKVRQGAKRVVKGVGQGAKRVVKGVGQGAKRVVKGVGQGAKRVVKGAQRVVGLRKKVGRPSSGKPARKRTMGNVVRGIMGVKERSKSLHPSCPKSPACPKQVGGRRRNASPRRRRNASPRRGAESPRRNRK